MSTGARVLVVEDEPVARRGLRRVLSAMARVATVAECANGADAMARIAESPYDLVVLDVQMPGIDGLEVMKRLGSAVMPPTVFVTAHDAYAVHAFELAAIDYVLKPYTDARLRASVDRALDRGAERSARDHLDRLVAALAAPVAMPHGAGSAAAGGSFLRRILATAGRRGLIIPVEQILWIEADDYCANVITRGRRAAVRESLVELEARLDPAQFVRTHRSALVRIDAVCEVRRSARGLHLVLSDGTVVPVARARAHHVVEVLGGVR